MFDRWELDDYFISTDPSILDLDVIHDFLSKFYWAENISKPLVEKLIQNSICFGIYSSKDGQVGFSRVVTDRTTFAYLGDVFVLEKFRGEGLSKWLMTCIVSHKSLQGLRRFCLGTRDAHELYSKFGFEVIRQPENWMEIKRQGIYKNRT